MTAVRAALPCPCPAPRLETQRLVLRAWSAEDASAIPALANDMDVAGRLARMPFPYTARHALDWVTGQRAREQAGDDHTLAITLRDTGDLIGSTAVFLSRTAPQTWEIGYWLGKPFWGQGYATEAVDALRDWTVRALGAERIYAEYMTDNTASGRTLEKLGFRAFGAGTCASVATGTAPPSVRMIWPADAPIDDLTTTKTSGSCG